MRSIWILLATLLHLSRWWISVSADELSIPASWRSKTFADSQSTRIGVAQRAIARIMQNVTQAQDTINNMDPWQIAGVVWNIALADLAAGTMTHQDVVPTLLNQYDSHFGFENSLKENGLTPLSCIYGYRAYQQDSLLALAKKSWQAANVYFVTEDNAASGHHPQLTTAISSKCLGFSTAGAVLWFTNKTDTSVRPSSVAQFAALSALLADQTKESVYIDAALLSAKFVLNLLTDSSGLILDGIQLQDCSRTISYTELNSGYAIQAWSVLADVSSDEQWRAYALKTLNSSTTTPQWTNDNGIILTRNNARLNNDNDGSSKGIYVSCLYELWFRNRQNATLSNYIQAFVATQYHALRDFATEDGSDFYNAAFTGPKIGYWTRVGVMASTPVLAIAAAPFENAEFISTSTGVHAAATSSAEVNETTSHNPSIAPIIGGVVGGVLALVILVLLILRCRRSRRHLPVWSDGHQDILKIELDTPSSSQAQAAVIPREKVRHELAQAMNSNAGTPGPSSSREIPMDQLVELVYERLQTQDLSNGRNVNTSPSLVSDAVEVALQRLRAEQPTVGAHHSLPVPAMFEQELPPYVR